MQNCLIDPKVEFSSFIWNFWFLAKFFKTVFGSGRLMNLLCFFREPKTMGWSCQMPIRKIHWTSWLGQHLELLVSAAWLFQQQSLWEKPGSGCQSWWNVPRTWESTQVSCSLPASSTHCIRGTRPLVLALALTNGSNYVSPYHCFSLHFNCHLDTSLVSSHNSYWRRPKVF